MATDDFFRARLDQMIDLRHPLAVLSTRMPWADIESSLAPVFAHAIARARESKARISSGRPWRWPGLASVTRAGRGCPSA
jgi:IS5 family transposase